MSTMTRTLGQRIAEAGITAEANYVDSPTDDQGWQHNLWTVTLRDSEGAELETPFRMGLGLTGEPTAKDVLESMLSDASGFENSNGFEDWAGDYGYDTDSRKAEATYRAVEEQTSKLRTFLGDAYEAFLWETDES